MAQSAVQKKSSQEPGSGAGPNPAADTPAGTTQPPAPDATSIATQQPASAEKPITKEIIEADIKAIDADTKVSASYDERIVKVEHAVAYMTDYLKMREQILEDPANLPKLPQGFDVKAHIDELQDEIRAVGKAGASITAEYGSKAAANELQDPKDIFNGYEIGRVAKEAVLNVSHPEDALSYERAILQKSMANLQAMRNAEGGGDPYKLSEAGENAIRDISMALSGKGYDGNYEPKHNYIELAEFAKQSLLVEEAKEISLKSNASDPRKTASVKRFSQIP